MIKSKAQKVLPAANNNVGGLAGVSNIKNLKLIPMPSKLNKGLIKKTA